MTNNFQELLAWQKAHQFVLMVYNTTRTFPEWEKFRLCSQFERAAVSIAANIAEGYKRLSPSVDGGATLHFSAMLENYRGGTLFAKMTWPSSGRNQTYLLG